VEGRFRLPRTAIEVQSRNRELLQAAFARGLSCLGYERDAGGNGRFQLGRWEENVSYAPTSSVEKSHMK